MVQNQPHGGENTFTNLGGPSAIRQANRTLVLRHKLWFEDVLRQLTTRQPDSPELPANHLFPDRQGCRP